MKTDKRFNTVILNNGLSNQIAGISDPRCPGDPVPTDFRNATAVHVTILCCPPGDNGPMIDDGYNTTTEDGGPLAAPTYASTR